MTGADESLVLPEHYLATFSGGAPLRLTKNVDFGQATTAPFFIDGLLGYIFAGSDGLRHGVGLGASINLEDDGGFREPVLAFAQFVLMPAYVAYLSLDRDFLLLGHAGIPLLLSGGRSVGFELAAGLGYRLLSGVGIFGEAGLSIYPGVESTTHALLSLELGVFMDYEVLP